MHKIQAQLLLLCILLSSAVNSANELLHDPDREQMATDSTEGHFILMPSSSRSKLYSLTHHHDHEFGPLTRSNIRSKKASLEIRKVGNDIDGDNYYDFSGTSVTLSENGEFLSVGAFGVNGYTGHVRNFKFDHSTQSWVQRGQDLIGEGGGDESGSSVSLSHDGMRLAIGAPLNSRYYGHARAFKYDTDTDRWIQLGDDIDGHKKDGHSGSSVAFSGDGNHLAIGSPQSDTLAGYVRIYEFVEEDEWKWKQLGPTLFGDQYYTSLGNSLSLNYDGHRIVIGSCFDFKDGVRLVGAVGVFHYIAGEWILLGSELKGESYYDLYGNIVDISSEGNRIVIGTPNEDDGLLRNVGKAEVYEYNDTLEEWVLLGNAILGNRDFQGLGRSASISSDGTRIVVGAEHCDDGGNNAGCTWVFEYDSVIEDWWQIGNSIYGEYPGDRAGRAVAISANGECIAIGAPCNEYYSGHTRVYSIVDPDEPSLISSLNPSHSPSLQPTSSPTKVSSNHPSHSPSLQPTSSPTKGNHCRKKSHRLLRIELKMDNNGETDNSFAVKKYVESTALFTEKVMKKKRGQVLSNTHMVFEKCLPEDACYKFSLFDQTGDGICCDTGRGYYRVFWDGNLVTKKRDKFKNGKRRKSRVFGNGCNNEIKLKDLMMDEMSQDFGDWLYD